MKNLWLRIRYKLIYLLAGKDTIIMNCQVRGDVTLPPGITTVKNVCFGDYAIITGAGMGVVPLTPISHATIRRKKSRHG